MFVQLLILNYNGRRLLAECLPSVLRAAEVSRHRCEAAVIDNDSSDDSVAFLAEHFPGVRVIPRPNRGLCSFNDVLAESRVPVAVLLNNDVKLEADCIDPLVAPLARTSACFMTTPLVRRLEDGTCEGNKTAVRWRWGLVQATALYPGHRATIHRPGLTAGAGSVMAVDCRKFAAIGGFDPLFLPGRLEDLDFALRGYLAGYHARYVPRSVAYHLGMGTFGAVFGRDGCDRLALRNTLLLQWKNLRSPTHLLRQVVGLPIRLVGELCRAPWVPRRRRWAFIRALIEALARGKMISPTRRRTGESVRREREFFRRFHPRRIDGPGAAARFGPSPVKRPAPGAKPTVTAAVITLNEEEKLAGLLRQLAWTDEIVVVDGGSHDATVEIARSHGCRVASRPLESFADQRNYARRLATGDWVFSIDADERPTPRLIAEIGRRIRGSKYDGFRVPIRSRIFGRAVRWSGTQDDCPVRLFRRGAGCWAGDVHEVLRVAGRVGRLENHLLHQTTADLQTYLAKMHRYTLLEAKARVAAGRRPAWTDTWIAPAGEVFRRLIYKQGLLDGPAGWAFCLLSGLSQWTLARQHRRLWKRVVAPSRLRLDVSPEVI